MPKSELPNFEKVANLCLEHGSQISPSMLQGWLVGLLATGARPNENAWVSEAVEFLDLTQTPNEKLLRKLARIFDRTFAQLVADDMGFFVYLPEEDEEDVELRIEGFRVWCEGFLQGFGQSGRVTQEQLSGDAQELLNIFAAFTQASYDDELTPAENDRLLEELLEHAKVGALTLFFEYGQPAAEH